MPSGWYGTICCICFREIDRTNAFIDSEGQAWDAHALICAFQAGMTDVEPTEEEWHRSREAEYQWYRSLVLQQIEEESIVPRWEDEGGSLTS